MGWGMVCEGGRATVLYIHGGKIERKIVVARRTEVRLEELAFMIKRPRNDGWRKPVTSLSMPIPGAPKIRGSVLAWRIAPTL